MGQKIYLGIKIESAQFQSNLIICITLIFFSKSVPCYSCFAPSWTGRHPFLENRLCCTSSRDLLQDILLRNWKRRKKPQPPALIKPRTSVVLLHKRALYCCATTPIVHNRDCNTIIFRWSNRFILASSRQFEHVPRGGKLNQRPFIDLSAGTRAGHLSVGFFFK